MSMGNVAGNRRPVLECGPGRTKQSFKDECDIQNILSRYHKTGMVSHLAAGVPRFVDVSEVGSYREAMERMLAAKDYFMKLPAKVRAEFNHDPAEYVELLSSEGAQERLEELAAELYPRKAPKAPERAPEPVVTPPEPEAPGA